MKKIFLLFLVGILISCEYTETMRKTVSSTSGQQQRITNANIISALKEALTEGARYSTRTLSQKDGYYKNPLVKINLPPEAESIIKSINLIPGGEKLLENVIENINKSAEDAAKEIMPIFTAAIKSMTITDAINILKGGNTSITEYFKNKTYNQIKVLYASKINKSLDKPFAFNISANSSWKNLVDANNSIANTAAGKLVGMNVVEDETLGSYATEKALDGLFYMVSEEEKKIRKNPLGYSSEMIKKVFGGLLEGKI